MLKQSATATMGRTRKKGRPYNRWRDEVEEDLNVMRIRNRVAVVRDKWGMEEECIGSPSMQQSIVLEKQQQQKKKKKNRNLSPEIYMYFRIHYIKLKKSHIVPGPNSVHSCAYKSKIFIPNIACSSQ